MNKRNLIMAAALMPLMALAQQNGTATADTTVMFNGQKIEVSQSGDRTSVAVYKADGNEMRKTSETQYVDGQEVERVYVTSPFVPKTFGKKRSLEYSHYPTIFAGASLLAGSAFGMSSAGNYTTDNLSSEWGIMGCSLAFPLSSSLAITSALSVGQVRHNFKRDFILSTVDGNTSLQPFAGENEGDRPKKSYLIYWNVRVPIMLEWSRRYGHDDLFAAIGPSVEFRFSDRSRYQLGKKKHTVSKDNNMNPVGINLEARLGYGCFLLYARTALTPLLKTGCAPEWHPFTVGIGCRL